MKNTHFYHSCLVIIGLLLFPLWLSAQQEEQSPLVKNSLEMEAELAVHSYSFLLGDHKAHQPSPWLGARRFHLMKTDAGIVCVWQDAESKAVLRTLYPKQMQSQSTIDLTNTAKGTLLTACGDEAGNIYYATYTQNENGGGVKLMLTKATNKGEVLASKTYDTSAEALNIWQISERWMADMQFAKGNLLLMMGRLYYKGGDGLNHQGGGAFLFDANTLELKKSFGQTSGHSFDNYISANTNEEFLAIDLGDNYPRGVHLHKFPLDSYRKGKVVYTFKTLHGTRPSYASGMPSYPKYDEISKGGTTYYKWSNDNGTYTELGGVAEVNDGYLVFFLGEPSPEGKSIDNSRIDAGDPRNVGFVKVKKDFDSIREKKDIYLSKGIDESGGFYSFGGSWSAQENHGVSWLSDYKQDGGQTARHLKIAPLPNEQFLLIWEAVDADRQASTYALKLDSNGKPLSTATKLGNIPLTRRDEPLVVGSKVYIVSPSTSEFVLYEIAVE